MKTTTVQTALKKAQWDRAAALGQLMKHIAQDKELSAQAIEVGLKAMIETEWKAHERVLWEQRRPQRQAAAREAQRKGNASVRALETVSMPSLKKLTDIDVMREAPRKITTKVSPVPAAPRKITVRSGK